MSAYYNEIDPQKAQWIRELIKAGVVAPGDVDERSIKDVRPEDLRNYAQCHFFAGIAVWSYALRCAGWPDGRPVWTGSCPCPSFSCAGKGGGFSDPRHLWPDWARLVEVCRPPILFGEQSDDAIGFGWLDLVQTDMEASNYAFGKAVLGACSVGAPHIRQRLYFVADAGEMGQRGRRPSETSAESGALERSGRFRDAGELADADIQRCGETRICEGEPRPSGSGDNYRLGDASVAGLQRHAGNGVDGHEPGWFGARQNRPATEAGYVNGFWRDADWVLRARWNRPDPEWCPTEPGTFPLAHGVAARVLRLRGYGDAICAPLAQAFIEAYLVDL